MACRISPPWSTSSSSIPCCSAAPVRRRCHYCCCTAGLLFSLFTGAIECLAYLERFGGRVEEAFSVRVPSLPGYDFCPPPTLLTGPRRIAGLLERLTTGTLGFESYLVHSGDCGSATPAMLGLHHAAHAAGLNLTVSSVRHHGVPPRLNRVPDNASVEKRVFATHDAAL